MLRKVELAFFSLFFIFPIIKTLSSNMLDIDILTYTYYFIITLFLGNYFLSPGPTKVHLLLFAFSISIIWLVVVGLINAEPDFLVFNKLRGLLLSLFSIPIAIYMYRRGLLEVVIISSSIFLVALSVVFVNFVTYDQSNPAYILNSVYLHGSFLAGFIALLAIYMRMPILWPILLLGSLIVLGGRGPFLSLFIVSMFMFTGVGIGKIKKRFVKKKGVSLLIALPPFVLVSPLFLMPDFYDRMLARWLVMFSTPGGGASFVSRVDHLSTSLAAMATSPFVGIGIANYGMFKYGFAELSYPHNIILEVLVESGVIGGLPFLFCIAFIFFKSFGNKTWPLLLYVFICLLMSYSYSSLNELYVALAFSVIARIEIRKDENTRSNR